MKAKGVMMLAGVALILASLGAGIALAAGLPAMHVGGIQAGYEPLASGGYAVWALVAIDDMEHMPVPGATVSVQWTVPPGAGGPRQRAVTNFQGLARFQVQSVERGVYRVCVTGVAKSGLVYAPSLNEETCRSVRVR
jgi:hypothetical protein